MPQGEDLPVEPSRSNLMRRVATKGSKPEMRVRRALHAAGFRFRVHRRDLPGTPDIVLPRHRIAIFVHGCFWHRHPGCKRTTTPKTRTEFWQSKFEANQARDARVCATLRDAGWDVIVVWECETMSSPEAPPILQRLAARGTLYRQAGTAAPAVSSRTAK